MEPAYVVVERTHRHRVSRLVSGSIATTPVPSVPHGWVPDASGPSVVTVAVQDVAEVPELVGLAAGEARARGAELVVLHVVAPDLGRRHSEVHDRLDAAVRTVAHEHDDVEVRLEVVLGRAADVLVQTSRDSALLVVGRRHHGHAWGTHLGAVVRRVLLDAACPVLLSPGRDADADDEGARRPAARRSPTTRPSRGTSPSPSGGPRPRPRSATRSERPATCPVVLAPAAGPR